MVATSLRSVQRLLRLTAVQSVPRVFASSVRQAPLQRSRLEVELASPSALQPKPAVTDLGFGRVFTDHMLRVVWTEEQGWQAPRIVPFQNIPMHPGAKVLHYAQELFEGMKAYRGVDDRIRFFRPMHNMARMNVTALRCCLPTFDGRELLECMRKLVQIEQEWVPHDESSSLYLRPFMFGTEPTLGVAPSKEVNLLVILSPVGPYFSSTHMRGVNLLADPEYVRAWPGGCGFAKMGSNYAPTLYIGKIAEKLGCHQVLWLFGPEHELTEVGAMNIFLYFEHKDGRRELVTPHLHKEIILAGVTRRSILEMTREWNEFEVNERMVTMKEVMTSLEEGTLKEVFGAGTAAVVSPVGGIHYARKMNHIPVVQDGIAYRVMKAMTDIYYGRVQSPWAIDLEDWHIDERQALADYQPAAEALRHQEVHF